MTHIKTLLENVQRNPNSPRAWVELADTLEAVGKHGKALYCRLQVAKLNQKLLTGKEPLLPINTINKSGKSNISLFAGYLLSVLTCIFMTSVATMTFLLFIAPITRQSAQQLMYQETPFISTMPALILADAPRAPVDIGSLYVFVVEKNSGISIPNASVSVRLSDGTTTTVKTNNTGMAYFRVE